MRAQAGLLIAETEFALQVESDIAPYKGLLMGLFFMTVGMEISAGLFFAKLRTVLAAIAVLIIGKVRAAPRCSSFHAVQGLPVLASSACHACELLPAMHAVLCAGNWGAQLCWPPPRVPAHRPYLRLQELE